MSTVLANIDLPERKNQLFARCIRFKRITSKLLLDITLKNLPIASDQDFLKKDCPLEFSIKFEIRFNLVSLVTSMYIIHVFL